MKTWMILLLLLPVAAVAAFVLVVGRDRVWQALFGAPAREAVDFATLDPGTRPNRHIVCPPGTCAAADAESPVYEIPAERLREAWLRMTAGRPHTNLVATSPDGWQFDHETRTPLLRFPDTVTARIMPVAADRATLAIYSRSHYGYSDFGTNKRRVSEWLEALEGEIASSR